MMIIIIGAYVTNVIITDILLMIEFQESIVRGFEMQLTNHDDDAYDDDDVLNVDDVDDNEYPDDDDNDDDDDVVVYDDCDDKQ